MNAILAKYIGQEVGLNYKSPAYYNKAKLLAVEADYFTYQNPQTKAIVHVPLRQIIAVMEGEKLPVADMGIFKAPTVPLCIQSNVLFEGNTIFGLLY